MHIKLEGISRRHAQQTIIDNISLDIEAAELLTLLGPSGCGKTTLLRMIAGLDRPDAGRILFDGRDTKSWTLKERKVGFVFQHYALFPHLTVAENIMFGPRLRERSARPTVRAQIDQTEKWLSLVQLDGLAARYPHQLSGGQRQRVALARALAIEPQVLLLDEPFGALDARVRKELRACLRELQQKLEITCVLVTHDQEEALDIADRIVLLRAGRLEQMGRPESLFAGPSTAFALNFLGSATALPTAEGEAWVRPHEIELFSSPPASSDGRPARVKRISVRGTLARIELDASPAAKDLSAEISVESWAKLGLAIGSHLYWRPKRMHFFG